MLRWLTLPRRILGKPAPLPSVQTPIVHLQGPGRVHWENERLLYDAGWSSGPMVRQLALDPASLKMVLCYGSVEFSCMAMRSLMTRGIDVALLNPAGTTMYGWLSAFDGQRALQRLRQFTAVADRERRLVLGRRLIADKIHSQIGGARHYQRHGHAAATAVLDKLAPLVERAENASSLESLLGIEGTATAAWFELFSQLLRAPFSFSKRVHRPPTDPVNSLLSLGYTLLLNRTAARISALGFDVALGLLHEFRAGRPSLACDQVEPLRVAAVDRWVLRILNEKRLSTADFVAGEGGEVRLTQGAFAKVLAGWELHWFESRCSDLLDEQLRRLSNQLSDLAGPTANLLRCLEQKPHWPDP